jgi:aminoglycoside phosphotransferase (APT) family kinase protein
MRPEEIHRIATALDTPVVATDVLAGGYSHETCLLTLADRRVVARLGGPDPAVEAAVMAAARPYVPVPRVLHVLPADDPRPVMILEYVTGTPLGHVLEDGDDPSLAGLGAEVGRAVAGIATVTFDRPGFFAGEKLAVRAEPPWSRQLAEFAATCMAATNRLDQATRDAWADLCAAHAPALAAVDDHARLVHADINPKNILVSRTRGGWRVDAVLDWEFAYSGCPYGDAANMARFEPPRRFLDGFRAAVGEHQPDEEWEYLGRVLDMFALSDLLTRPDGHPVADRAAGLVRRWVAEGVPRAL